MGCFSVMYIVLLKKGTKYFWPLRSCAGDKGEFEIVSNQ